MNVAELEQRWKSIIYTGPMPYRSLRISADCIPELFLALDIKGNRFLILQVPDKTIVQCPAIKMQNLSLEWHEQTRFILIGLLNNRFADLYNDLTLSLYNRIKNVSDPESYTSEFINSFHKWMDFFDEAGSSQLSETELKGLFGELTMLKWYLNNETEMQPDDILNSWQGPYSRPQDFIFPGYNLEIKTKNTDELNVRISSEYQLQSETGKDLRLGIIDVQRAEDGICLQTLIDNIRVVILAKVADLSVFLKTLSKAGLGGINAEQYDSFKWKSLNAAFYDCNIEGFPKIINSQIQTGISRVEYNLNVSILNAFFIQKINL